MTPQDKIQPTQESENEFERVLTVSLLTDDEQDESDTEEQEETFEFLRRVLDEDRFTTRKLFP